MRFFVNYSDNNTNIGSYYTGIGSNVYYLNNFDHLVRSYGESIAYICM